MEARLEAAARKGVRALILRAGDSISARARPATAGSPRRLVAPGQPVKTIPLSGGQRRRSAPGLSARRRRDLRPPGRPRGRAARLRPLPLRGRLGRQDGTSDGPRHRPRRPARAVRTSAACSPLEPAARSRAWSTRSMRELAQRCGRSRRHPVRRAWTTCRLAAFLGEEPHTPLDVAVRATMQGLGVPLTTQTRTELKRAHGTWASQPTRTWRPARSQ
ncbi:hypothetical protein ACRAWD_28895 [Caulobacter segnis]